MTTGDSPPVKATTTSSRVVDTLLELEGATITELDEQMDLSRSSIHNHLETLEHLGFIVREDWTYRVSHRFSEIGVQARRGTALYRHGVPEARRLADVSGLVSAVVVFERGRATSSHVSTGKNVNETILEVGDVLPLHSTAPGKAILSELDDARVEELEQPALTDDTLTSTEALREELATIRSRGIAFDREEWQSGIRGIATVINGPGDELLGAVTVMSTSDWMSGKRFQQDIPGLVVSSGNTIEEKIRSR